jgi:enoyl-CoA hydratase/carnithine racemase
MPKVLVIEPLWDGSEAYGSGVVNALLRDVTAFIESSGERADPFMELRVEGRYRACGHGESVPRPGRLASAARDLDRARRKLHARGGILACVTTGASGGPWLEIALMSDVHLMESDASLIPPGLDDAYVPCAGGWGHLMRRAGPGRAATILWGGGPETDAIGSRRAIELGLADGEAGALDAFRAAARAGSPVATRLVLDLWERAAGGALTARQGRDLERACFALAFASAHPGEGIAAFFEGRPARFTQETP